MYGRVDFRSLQRSSSQHMQSVPPSVTTDSRDESVVGNHYSSIRSVATAASGDSFFQEGRQVCVGDCALFKPPQDSPPLIGLVRWLKVEKENNLQLGLNWLYRAAELNLGNSVVEEGAPNEVFYSFNKDEISAASLLHPCKVAFLPRGVELRTGTSSFVCRRVYDAASKCLRWLTDQDYIDERQEEVDGLLLKTRTEMHAMLQPSGRSPKQANGPSSTTPLKLVDSGQNSGSSLNSQARGKKRERSDHGSDPLKRERSLKADDADSLQCKIESNLKSEIAQITEKDGIVVLEGVDKLIQLMQLVKTEIKVDLGSRSVLAGVMAATDKVDCLSRFVQLGGLTVLDQWLQDIHKGQIGDGSNLKDADKSVEEFLLVLLRALDKLPVNLCALQMCNIGKSVNNLRSHKNLEIQRKARSLVDMWKKRVEAEMNNIDAKSAANQGESWPSKSRIPEASHCSIRTPRGSVVSMRNSSTQNSAPKTVSSRSSQGDANVKSAASPTGMGKQASPPSVGQENHLKNSAAFTLDKEDRGDRANQLQNHGLSYSVKDEGVTTTSGSTTAHKLSSSSSRSKKVSSHMEISGNASHKEINISRSSSSQKVAALEKGTHSALNGEKVIEGAVSEGMNQKLIVKIPNRVCSPVQGDGEGVIDNPAYTSSQVSSPFKHGLVDCENRIDAYRSNLSSDRDVDSRHDCDLKDVSNGSAGGPGPCSGFPDAGQSMATDDSRRSVDNSLPKSQRKPVELHSSSFSPMNALIESCVKYSEVDISPSREDDGGMNLLASVATREMSKSDLISPTNSTEISPRAAEVCIGDVEKYKLSREDLDVVCQSQTCNDAESDAKLGHLSTDRISQGSDEIPTELNKFSEKSGRDTSNTADVTAEKLDEIARIDSLPGSSAEKARENKFDKKVLEQNATFNKSSPGCISKSKSGRLDDVETEEKVNSYHGKLNEVNHVVLTTAPNLSCERDRKNDSNERPDKIPLLAEKSSSSVIMPKIEERFSDEKAHQTAYDQKPLLGAVDEVNTKKSDVEDGQSHLSKSGLNFDAEEGAAVADKSVHDGSAIEMENKVTTNHSSTAERQQCSARADGEVTDRKTHLGGAKSASVLSDAEEDYTSSGTSDGDGKMKFDLNEGLSADEERFQDTVSLKSAGATSVQMINSLTYPVNSIPHVNSSSITVASAAKGPFVPPEDLLRSKGELGWKGSAATSAFRPAEPRRALETTLGSPMTMSCSDASTINKSGRVPLDIDLNVPDEGLVEETVSQDYSLASNSLANFITNHVPLVNKARSSRPVSVHSGSGGLDLDLNAVDEANDNANNCSTSTGCIGLDPVVHAKQLGSGLASGDARRGFDLNDGPGVEEANAEMLLVNQQVKGGGVLPPHPPPSPGLRMNGSGLGSFSSWFPTGNMYPTMAIPSMLPDRGDRSFPVFQPNTAQRPLAPSGTVPFAAEAYRGSVISSSPAMNFPSGPFHFPFFPFGTSFPVPSANATSYGEPSSASPRLFAPPLHQQLLGPVGAVSSQFPRPYVVSVPESSNNGNGPLDNNSRRLSRAGLDLNAGPGVTEAEPSREEMFPLTSGQQFVVSSRALTEEQDRIYSASSGSLKRKESEGGLENDSFRYNKQPSWQ